MNHIILLLLFCLVQGNSCNYNTTLPEFPTLSKMVLRLEEFAPLETATEWDNVGLLVEPSGQVLIKRMLVTNDLTRVVLDEAIDKKVDLIVAYHPPITKNPPYTNLKPITRLTHSTWKGATILKCIENRIAVYSPHTTWDSIDGGINDWILSVFNTSEVQPIRIKKNPTTFSGFDKSVKLSTSTRYSRELEEVLKGESKVHNFTSNNLQLLAVKAIEAKKANTELEFFANNKGILDLIDLVEKIYRNDTAVKRDVLKTLRIYQLDKPPMKNVGLGRIGFLKESIKISEVVSKMKDLLVQKTFRLALANDKTLDDKVGVLAVGAGSGQGLLDDTIADFIITGEMLHHDILHETHRGTSVLITDHSNTERGFIHVFKERFMDLLAKNNEQVEIIVSEFDRDPIQYI